MVAEQTKQPVEQAKKTFVDGEKQRPSKFVTVTDAEIASQQDVLDTFVRGGHHQEEFPHRAVLDDGIESRTDEDRG